MNLMKWANIILWGTGRQRLEVVRAVIDAVKIYKKGKPTKEGQEFRDLIKSDKVELIGFVPNISYIRASSRDEDDLTVIWDHKFSAPTLLYYLKDSPIMLVVNPNMSYNNSKLVEIEENSELIEIRDLKGIIG
ncbi:MAG: hypothetical protein EB120_08665 [Proteobacteria bacterium]|nr:hypothetical protein [Pseudomonadota bacterium]